MNNASLGNMRARFGAAHEHFATSLELVKKKADTGVQHRDATIRENPRQALSVVIVYNDMHAALRAVEALERLGCNFCAGAQQRFLSVPVAQLSEPSRFDGFLHDANSVDVIIVSYNSSGDFPLTLKKWIGACLTQKRAGDSTIVALLSSDERVDTPDSPRYQFLRDTVRAMGLDFFTPWTEADEADYMMEQLEVVG
jgi:hypothetical protein